MTFLVPCMRCSVRKACQIRVGKLALLRPAKVASVRWRCADRLAGWPVGCRVSTPVTSFEKEDGYDGFGFKESTEVESGVLVSHPRTMDGRVVVRLDREISGMKGPVQFVKRWPDQLTRIEGSVPVCDTCGRPEVAHGYECSGDDADNRWSGRIEAAIDSIGPVPGIAALAIGGSLFAALGGLL